MCTREYGSRIDIPSLPLALCTFSSHYCVYVLCEAWVHVCRAACAEVKDSVWSRFSSSTTWVLGLNQARLHSVLASLLIYSLLFFETRSLTKPGAYRFHKTGWPKSCRDLPPQCWERCTHHHAWLFTEVLEIELIKS